jgi:hypothetical protein
MLPKLKIKIDNRVEEKNSLTIFNSLSVLYGGGVKLFSIFFEEDLQN